jgi:membrane protease YdiL (CAAX protease family)
VSDDLFSEIETTPELSLHAATEDMATLRQELRAPARRRIDGHVFLSWFVVLLLAALLMTAAILDNLNQSRSDVSPIELLSVKGIGQQVLAMESDGLLRNSLKQIENVAGPVDEQVRKVVESCNSGPLEMRFGYTILVNETRGGVAAIESLDAVLQRAREAGVELTDDQMRIARTLREQFASGAAPRTPLSETDRQWLGEKLGWISQLLIYPRGDDSPERAALESQSVNYIVNTYLLLLLGLVVVVSGFFVACLLGYLAIDRLTARMADDSRCGPVYIETFAIWFSLFVGIQLLAGVFGLRGGAATIVAMLLPLVALAWPACRGVDFAQFRLDAGLSRANPLVECFCGIVFYMATLPFLVVGLLAVQVLSAAWYRFTAPNEFAPQGIPHPIARDIINGDPYWALVVLLLTTAVAAPLIEEIMFRGILFRHLRDASHHMARWTSVLFSAVINGLVFAAIHPQGIVAIPALAMLGFSFCLARQWRGSLIAPITMHAIHNATITFVIWRMFL